MSKEYSCRPSDFFKHELTDYERFCFDEACTLFVKYINEKKVPRFEEDRQENSLLKRWMEEG